MGKRTPSAPPPPDPYATAAAQTEQNQATAAYNAALNRFNTYTPWGSQSYEVVDTDRVSGAPIYEQTIELSPEQQALYDQQIQQNLALGNTASAMLGNLPYDQPIDTSGLPSLQGGLNVGGPELQGSYETVGPQMGLNRSGLPGLESDVGLRSQYDIYGPQMGLDTSGLPALPSDLNAFRDEAETALYDRNTAYLDRDFERREESLRSRLANQGIVEGSEAYRNAIDDFERGRETAYRQARNEAIAGGGAEASRMFDIGSRSRGQLYGEALSGGAFANQAAALATGQQAQAADFGNRARGQDYAEALASRGQLFGEEATAGDFGNRAAAQATAQNEGVASFGNLARNQAMVEALTGADFANQARRQGFDEMMTLRNQPLNEFNALRSLSQVNAPQFQGPAQVGTAPADITGAINQQYQGQLAGYNAQVASRNALLSGLFGLGGAAILASDERVKEDIHEVGELNDGTNIYLFRYKGDDTPQVGVMAQEIEQNDPSAVIERQGVKHVDYAKVLARAL